MGDKTKMFQRRTIRTAFFATIILYSLGIVVAGVVYVVTSGLQDNPYIAFLLLIAGAVGSILVAATIATIMHNLFSNLDDASSNFGHIRHGDVFAGYVTRFAWIIAPIVSSYGLLRIVEILR